MRTFTHVIKKIWQHRVLGALVLLAGGFVMQLAFLQVPEANAAYTVGNSVRFATTTSDTLTCNPAGAGNQQKWTMSMWMKRGAFNNGQVVTFFAARNSGSGTYTMLYFGTADTFNFVDNLGASLVSTAVFRDPAAWYHFVVSVDTTKAATSTRVLVYVNGDLLPLSGTYPTQNANLNVNTTATQGFGSNNSGSQYYEGYLADVYLVDGQALAPTSFGQYDTNGYWRPIAYTGTYGTNGFKLNFSNSGSLGADSSGSSNNFTVNNLTAEDQVIDTPTNGFVTFNPISAATPSYPNLPALSQGNLRAAFPVGASILFPTLYPTSGKWYSEFTVVTKVNSTFANFDIDLFTQNAFFVGGYDQTGQWWNGSAWSSGVGDWGAWAAGDTIGVAWNIDAGTATFYKNNVAQGSGVTFTAGTSITPILYSTVANAMSVNFGQGGTTTLTYDAASGGYFKYTPPTGYKALSTYNLPAPAITVPKNYFDAITYTSPVLLMHMDGTNGSTSFVDSSTAARTVSVVGNAQLSTAASKFGGASALFDGTGDRVTVPDSADLELGSSDFTIDFWMNRTPSMGGTGDVVAKRLGGNIGPFLFYSAANTLALYMSSNGTWDIASGVSCGSPSDGSWHHVALTRKGITLYCFLDGTLISNVTSSASLYDNTAPVNIGGNNGGTEDFPGYVDEVRIIKGVALWTANFTPPTSAFSHGVNTAGFQPDLVWLKDRTSANNHAIEDSVRGTSVLFSAISNAIEGVTGGGWIKSFDSNGFSIDVNAPINTAGNNYISWLWKKSPTIDGVDIVSYTGDNTSNRNISHSLGAAPDLVIVKSRTVVGDPFVWHSSLAGATSYLLLDSTAAVSTSNSPWGTGNFSSTQFMVTNNATNNTNYAPASGTTTVTYSTAGTYSFSVPDYAYMTVTVNGAGGGGGGSAGVASTVCGKGCVTYVPVLSTAGGGGGNSSFNGSVVGNGGGAGGGVNGSGISGGAGSNGTASGGDTNTTAGGTAGGGGGTNNCNGNSGVGLQAPGAGGAGGQAVKAYTAGAISGSITVVVGAGAGGGTKGTGDMCIGTNGTGSGAGSVTIAYSGGTTGTYVAYLFKGIDGFSKFGAYTGNASTDGPFVYTGFKPKYLLIKRSDAAGEHWIQFDAARNNFNSINNYLLLNSNGAEGSVTAGQGVDFLANGFKIRYATASLNTSSGTYTYAAFADVPFKYSAYAQLSTFVSAAVSFLIGMEF